MKHFCITITSEQAIDSVNFIAEYETVREVYKLSSPRKYTIKIDEIPVTEQVTPLTSEEAHEKVKNTILHRYDYRLEPEGIINNVKLPEDIVVADNNCLVINCDYKTSLQDAEACKKEIDLMSWIVTNFKAVYAGTRNTFRLLDDTETIEDNTLQLKKTISHVFDRKGYVSVHTVTSIREIVEIK